MIKKFLAFTLSEILIALTVIGVVAVLVIPQLVLGQKAAQGQAQFNTAYSLMSKAIADMEADDISTEPTHYGTPTRGNGQFYSTFKEYHRIVVDCGQYSSTNESVCLSTSSRADEHSYKALSGRELIEGSEKNLFDDGAFVLNNGMLVMLENVQNNPNGLLIFVDINGKNKLPNRMGYDVFGFELVNGGNLLPMGAPGTNAKWANNADAYCNPNNSGTYSGFTCAYKAATDQDYFKKLYKGY